SRFETTVESCQHLLPALRQEAADAIDELFGRHEGPGRITGRPPYARASWGGIAAVSPAGRSAVRVASSDDAHSRYRPQYGPTPLTGPRFTLLATRPGWLSLMSRCLLSESALKYSFSV